MYTLLSSHVLTGDGRSGTARLAAHQAASAIAIPQSGSSKLITRFIRFSGAARAAPYDCRLLILKDRAYASGSLPSKTLSKSVIFVSTGAGVFTPISFIASL